MSLRTLLIRNKGRHIDRIGKDLIICHYPPYASKWNPIEHRLFAHVHAAIQGVVFNSYETVKILIDKTATNTGLKVVSRIVKKQYPIGEKIDRKDVEYHRIQFRDKVKNKVPLFGGFYDYIPLFNILLSVNEWLYKFPSFFYQKLWFFDSIY